MPRPDTRLQSARQAALVAAAYLLVTIVMTWPLARGLARDVPSDLQDPLLNIWIMAWDVEQLRAIAGGHLGRIGSFFDANIFHPAPLSLAYSEHLFAQAVQAFPVSVATGNPLLAYNLVLLSTFVVSGLGCFLLVRELTGSARAGFVAGLLFAFAPYRWPQIPHVQVLSAQWMPFVLYGFRRYFASGRVLPLAGAAIALILQNLSCGYYLLYFTPIVVAYVAWEIATRDLWRSRKTWTHLIVAALFVVSVTVPFLVPYKQVRDRLQMSRDTTEVVRYSADVYSYFTAFYWNRAWGSVVRAYPKPEGDLFPGAVPLLLAIAGLGAWMANSIRSHPPAQARAPRWLLTAIAALGGIYLVLAIVTIFTRRVDLDIGIASIRATNITRLLVPSVASAIALLWLVPGWRARAAAAVHQPEAIFLVILLMTWWLSLGPSPRALGRSIELWSPYGVLYRYVPGFDGLRVPARFAMIGTLAMAVLAGLAAVRLRGAPGAIIVGVLTLAFLAETRLVSFSINGISPLREYVTPEAHVYRPARAPAVYRELARVDAGAIVLEMPIGEPQYDVRAVYYSTAHWRRLVNGYSGFFPPHYSALLAVLSDVMRGDDLAWRALGELNVSHVVVHEGAYLDDEGTRVSTWLRERGATEMFRDGRDVLFLVPH